MIFFVFFFVCFVVILPEANMFLLFGAMQLRELGELLDDYREFVLKPNRGASGRGILVITGRYRDGFRRHDGKHLTLEDLRQHTCDILSGMYSLGGQADSALVQF